MTEQELVLFISPILPPIKKMTLLFDGERPNEESMERLLTGSKKIPDCVKNAMSSLPDAAKAAVYEIEAEMKIAAERFAEIANYVQTAKIDSLSLPEDPHLKKPFAYFGPQAAWYVSDNGRQLLDFAQYRSGPSVNDPLEITWEINGMAFDKEDLKFRNGIYSNYADNLYPVDPRLLTRLVTRPIEWIWAKAVQQQLGLSGTVVLTNPKTKDTFRFPIHILGKITKNDKNFGHGNDCVFTRENIVAVLREYNADLKAFTEKLKPPPGKRPPESHKESVQKHNEAEALEILKKWQ